MQHSTRSKDFWRGYNAAKAHVTSHGWSVARTRLYFLDGSFDVLSDYEHGAVEALDELDAASAKAAA